MTTSPRALSATFRPLLAVARVTVSEAAAGRLGAALACTAAVLAFGGAALGALTLDDPLHAARDLGLAGVDAAGLVLALGLGVGLTSRELAGAPAQVLLTRPVARWQLLAGKWLGLQAVVAGAVVALGGALAVALTVQGGAADRALATSVLLYAAGSSLSASLAVALATLWRPIPAATAGAALVVIGRSVPELQLAAARAGGLPGAVLRATGAVLPNLHLFVPAPAASVDGAYLIAAALYSVGYGLLLLAIAARALRRRDFV